MSNLTKPQRKQLERQISDAQQKLRQDDIKKCLDKRSKAIMKALSYSPIVDHLVDDANDDNYKVEQVFTQLFRNSVIVSEFLALWNE